MEYTISFNRDLYHGSDKKPFVLHNTFLWCALDYGTSVEYSKNVYSIKPQVPLKLIDITNGNFHNDFMNKINTLYSEKKLKQSDKWRHLVPLGLPSFKMQMMELPQTLQGTYPSMQHVDQSMLDTIEYYSEFFGNKHRYSIQSREFGNLDDELVKIIKHIYSNDIDGIISPSLWPSYHQGGFQHPEVCIFEPLGKVSVTKGNTGGGKKESKNYDYSFSLFKQELRNKGLDPNKMLKLNPLIYASKNQ